MCVCAVFNVCMCVNMHIDMYICALVCMDVCMCIYMCVCMYMCRNGGCIPWFLVHQGESISSKPKTVLQQSWEEV